MLRLFCLDRQALLLLLSVVISLTVRAGTHVFIIDGNNTYKGSAEGSSIIQGPYFMGPKFTVDGALTLMFDPNGSAKTNTIKTTTNGSNYGTLFRGNIIKLTPFNDVAITKVRISTVNDQSRGFVDNSGNALSRTGRVYEWTGSSTVALNLKVVSDDANNNLGFEYIEVTFGNEFVTEPDKPEPDKPEPDKPEPDKPEPDKPEPDKPDPDVPEVPEEIAPVIIYPEEEYISSRQTISISCATPGTTIYYTTNGTRPTKSSPKYSRPFRLSVATGCEVRAIAVSADGQTSEAQRRYYLDTVTSISDLFANGSTDKPVTLDTPLMLVYKNGPTAYMKDEAEGDGDFICVSDPDSYLRGIGEGRTLSGIECMIGHDGNTPAAVLTSRPEIISAGVVEIRADTMMLSRITRTHLHRLVAIKGCRVSRSGVLSQSGSTIGLDDRFGVVRASLTDANATVTGFVALGQYDEPVLRPTDITLTSDTTQPEPEDPDDGHEICLVTTIVIGEGLMEIFTGCNEHTKTPEGKLLTSPFNVDKGATIHIYFPEPDDLASLVVGTSALAPDNPSFVSTRYGLMLPVAVDSDMTIIATFATTTGVDSIKSDSREGEEWSDLSGRKLSGRPTTPGYYICRRGSGSAAVVRIAP